MPVLTRSNAVRRRNIVRNVTWVIRERMLNDDSDYELPENDSDSDYFPPSESDSESDSETEVVESDDETASVVSVASDDGEAMQERVERLRDDLRRAEDMLKKWQAEQDAQLRENNNTCLPIILTLAITWGIFSFLDLNVRHKQVNWS